MIKKDIAELKKRFTKEQTTFTRMSACFVNAEKNIVLQLNENFLNLEESDYFKYLEIAKKVLSGTIDNNLLQLNFEHREGQVTEKQIKLIDLKKSKLKDEELIEEFYKNIIDNYEYPENYLILLFHDVYDVMAKTSDNRKLDESEEVFEYILAAICPISLSKPGLSYYEEENTIKSRLRDWIVDPPINGFLYPGFVDRAGDLNTLIYYTKNTKDIHEELISDGLGCSPKETISLQKEKFQSLMLDSISLDEEESNGVYMEVQEKLNDLVIEHKSLNDEIDYEPIKLSKDELREILIESGLEDGNAGKIEEYYAINFEDSLPAAENLIDKKILQLNEQKKKERSLEKQVEFLKDKIDEIESTNENYDIVINVRPNKLESIKSEIIDGQEYIMIPVAENEKSIINELNPQ